METLFPKPYAIHSLLDVQTTAAMDPEKVSETLVDGTVDMIETKEAHGQNRLDPAQLMSK